MPAPAWLMDSPAGTAQLLVLVELALRTAALTGVGPAVDVETATLTTSYLRPATVDSGGFVARGRVVNSGRTYTLVDAVVEDISGRTVAHSMASVLVRPIEPAPPALTQEPKAVPVPVYPTPDPYARSMPGWMIDPTDPVATLRHTITSGGPAPPWMQLFGVRLLEVDEGRVSGVMPASEWFCSLRRTVSPGVLAYLALTGVNAAAATVSPPGHLPAVLSVNFTFLRPLIPDGRDLLARGSVTHHADNLVVSNAEITDGDGNRVTLAQETAALRPVRTRAEQAERLLATVLFTDIVGSTEHAERLGDAGWRDLLSRHHALVRSELAAFHGREVKTTGDGFLLTFDSPGRAVQCARAIRDGVGRFGLAVRAGLHTGECEVSENDLAGIAVHIASRVQSLAGPGEILVSATVRDLVAGSGLPFEDRGRHALKGIEGEWSLFAVTA
jgi:uncharacterized protein (TIGR00369 family)